MANAPSTHRLPPTVSGALPGVGHMFEFRGDYVSLFRRGQAEHGALFTVQLAAWPMVVFCGPEMHEVFYKRTDHELSMAKPYAYLKEMFGEVAFTAGPEAYEAERHVLHAPFQGGRMPGYVAIMQEETEAWLATLGEHGRFELVAAVQGLTQQISAHALMGRAFRDRMGRRFWELYADLAKGLDPILPPWLPIPKFIRRDRAKAELRPMIGAVVRERRSGAVRHEDVLQVLCETTLADGTLLSEEKVVSYVLALVFAGFETTTGHASWGLIQLLQHPEVVARVEAELVAAGMGGALSPATFTRMPLLKACLKESERLRPVADRHMRRLDAELDVGGYRIPAGWLAISGLVAGHVSEETFSDPHRYDPDRYERGEGKGAFALVGFGAGRHKCTGMAFAYTEMMVWLALLLDQYELELQTIDPQRRDFAGVAIPETTWVSYRRRGRPLSSGAQLVTISG